MNDGYNNMRNAGNDSYYRREKNPKFYFKENHLVHKIKEEEKIIYTFDPADSPDMSSFLILEVLEFTSHYVILLNWVVKRNILCFKKDTDELVWRVEKPKPVFKTRDNFWTEIDKLEGQENKVYCYSVDRYAAAFNLETCNIEWEYFPHGPDFRDF